uniref:Caspase-like protease 2 n=1 Tax=Suberites domuncula TaxID=55567 RepID=E0WCW0_SUBDO|nr:caspase-like protease 2 [Suberites domuncula]
MKTESEVIMPSVITTIKSHPNARGLAIIVTNDYDSPEQELTPLRGTVCDGTNMTRAFKNLHFAVHAEHNIGIHMLQQLIRETTQFDAYHKLKNHKCVAFVFSGHGNSNHRLYTQDGNLVCIMDDIIKPFQPTTECPSMGALPKLFFFDACRGKNNMKGVYVPSGSVGKEGVIEPVLEPRGVRVMKKLVCPESNFLIAYSTMDSYRAWEKPGDGGVWLTKLSERIQSRGESIDDVLTNVNEKLADDLNVRMQQPEKLSTLNKVLYLHPDHDDPKPPDLAIRPLLGSISHPDSTISPVQPVTAQSASPTESVQSETGTVGETDYVALLATYYPNFHFKDQPCVYVHHDVHEHRLTYYRSVVLSHLQQVVGDSQKYFVNAHTSRNEAARDAMEKLNFKAQGASAECHMPTQRVQAGSHNSSIPEKPSGLFITARNVGAQGSSSYEEQLQIFFKKNKIKPAFEFYSHQSNDATRSSRYRCVVRYTIDGKPKKVDSGSYFLRKRDAKEQVAKLVLSKEETSRILSL